MRASAPTEDVTAGSDADPWQELVWQEARQTLARRLNVPADAVRPCFARIGFAKQGFRNNTSFIYATELRRMGVAETTAWEELRRWNRGCRPPQTERALRSTFESAWKGEKAYGCRGLLGDWCVGRERCDWHAQNVAGRRKCRDTDFLDFGWPALLRSREALVYWALVRLEQQRGVGAGGLVIAATRDYVELSGVHRRHIMGALEALDGWGLALLVERGKRRETGLPSLACKVKRVVPVPEPPVAMVNRKRAALRA